MEYETRAAILMSVWQKHLSNLLILTRAAARHLLSSHHCLIISSSAQLNSLWLWVLIHDISSFISLLHFWLDDQAYHCLKMAPNQAPSSSAYESIDDFGSMYVEIMDLCRPFYSLKENGKHNSLPPRLDDALMYNQSGKNSPNNVSQNRRVHGYEASVTPTPTLVTFLPRFF